MTIIIKRKLLNRFLLSLIYLDLIIGTELLTVFNPVIGILLHITTLVLLLIHSTLSTDRKFSQLLLVLTLAPIIRILSLSLPLHHFSKITWFALISIPVYIAIFTCMHLQHLKPREIGLSPPRLRFLPIDLVMISVAFPVGLIEYQILKPEPIVNLLEGEALISSSIIMILSTGFLEELAFRGIIQYHATNTMGIYGIFYVSFVFSILHIGNLSIFDILLAFFVGLAYSIVVMKTGSIYGVSLSHGIINIVLFILAPAGILTL